MQFNSTVKVQGTISLHFSIFHKLKECFLWIM
nr:MAG TPA: hypothetical protein [Caudoviricetes sp.]